MRHCPERGIVSSRQCDPQLPRERHLSAEQRRALKFLADAGPKGCAGAMLLAHGFTIGLLADLVWHGLAMGHRETVRSGVAERSRWLASGLRTRGGR